MTTPHTLEQLYLQHDGKVSDKWSIYLAEYEHLFAPYRALELSLLEIGVQNGGSLEIWAKYFSSAKSLVGCDINEDCRLLVFDDPKISLILGDANTDDIEQEILTTASSFDLIIDDGSHKSGDIVMSFARYFKHLSDDGLYIAEDLHCSYWSDFSGGLFQPFSSIAFFKMLADIVNQQHWGIGRRRTDILLGFFAKYEVHIPEDVLSNVHSVEFINSLCVVRKKEPQKNVLGTRFIAGNTAVVWDGALQLHGTEQAEQDQRGNPWSISEASDGKEVIAEDEVIESPQRILSDKESEIRQLKRTVVECERLRVSQVEELRAKNETLLGQFIGRERELADQLLQVIQINESVRELSVQKNEERERVVLANLREFALQVETLKIELAELQKASVDRIHKLVQTYEKAHEQQGRQYAEREQKNLTQISDSIRQVEHRLSQVEERDKAVLDGLQRLQLTQERKLRDLEEQLTEQEQKAAFEIAAARQELDLHRLDAVGRETAFSAKFQELQHAHEQSAERESKRYAEREQVQLAQLIHLQRQIDAHVRHINERERSFVEQMNKALDKHDLELKVLRQTFAERERLLNRRLIDAEEAFHTQMDGLADIKKAHACSIAELQRELQLIEGNFLWRWTAPLSRAVTGLVRKLQNGRSDASL